MMLSYIIPEAMFDNLESLEFSIASLLGDFNIDSAVLTVDATPTPIPGAIWLLGTGFVSLIGLRKKLA